MTCIQRVLLSLVFLCALIGASSFTAHRAPYGPMIDGGVVMPPPGWLGWCSATEDELCFPLADPFEEPRFLTRQNLEELRNVHFEVKRIRWRPDPDGQDIWQVAKDKGDCEDIALAAMVRLRALGWPHRWLRLASGDTEQGIGHTVLTVDMFSVSQNTMVTVILDNRFPDDLMSWKDLENKGYTNFKRHAATAAGWVEVMPD